MMTAVAQHRLTAVGTWVPRLVTGARFASLLFLFVVGFLALAVVIPAVATGWQPLSVTSGSMQPAIQQGAMVLVQPAESDQYYGARSIIAFHDAAQPGRLVTHRVVSTETDDEGVVTYTTKGDANRVADSAAVPHGEVVGAVRLVVPFVGLPQAWLHGGDLVKVAALALASLFAVGALLVRGRP